MLYTATISRNFRDTTFQPKVLLRNVTDEQGNLVRDHMWVNLNNQLTAVLPQSNRTHYVITFHAKPKFYQTLGDPKLTLERVNNCSILCKVS